VLPKIAEGSGSQVWMIPSELSKALEGLRRRKAEEALPAQISRLCARGTAGPGVGGRWRLDLELGR